MRNICIRPSTTKWRSTALRTIWLRSCGRKSTSHTRLQISHAKSSGRWTREKSAGWCGLEVRQVSHIAKVDHICEGWKPSIPTLTKMYCSLEHALGLRQVGGLVSVVCLFRFGAWSKFRCLLLTPSLIIPAKSAYDANDVWLLALQPRHGCHVAPRIAQSGPRNMVMVGLE